MTIHAASLLHLFLRIAIASLLLWGLSVQAEEPSFTFAIVPQQSPSRLAKLWLPLLQDLATKSGLTLRFVTAPDIPTFETRSANGEYDFAYMNPFHYVVFHEKPGYVAFAKAKDKKLTGILVVHKDSPLHALKELDGKEVAFPSPNAFAASMLPQAFMEKLGIHVKPVYVKSHDAVYRNIAAQRYIAGGGVIRTLKHSDSKTAEQLKILWTSKEYTSHAFAYHPRIPKDAVNRLLAAMTNMHTYAQGQDLLKQLHLTGIEAADNAEWNEIRDLEIKPLQH